MPYVSIDIIKQTLSEVNYSYEKAAKILKVHQTYLRKQMRKAAKDNADNLKAKTTQQLQKVERKKESIASSKTPDKVMTPQEIVEDQINYIDNIKTAREKAISRYLDLVAAEKDTSKLANSIRTFNEIIVSAGNRGEDKDKKESSEFFTL